MLLTERLRIKAVIATVVVLMVVVTIVQLVTPDIFIGISKGGFELGSTYVIFLPFLGLELLALYLVSRRVAQNKDVPIVRRYLSALVETSVPTAALYLHMNWMGANTALAFAAPLTYFIFIILSTLRLDFWLSTFTGFVAAAEMFALAMLYQPVGFADEPMPEGIFQFVRAVMLFVGGVLAGAVGMQLRRQFEASIAATAARDHVTNLFGQHVSPQVVERLLASGTAPTTEMRRVAVMFVDIRDFTAATRIHTPRQVVERLDDAFAVLVDVLDRHSGIVNKFLGDGFLALFGAPIEDPGSAQCAVDAAREMLEEIARNNQGSAWPLRIGIGIHMGAVIAGNVGSPRRKEYTVMGDTVNFAARLEALNKEFGSQLLISSAVRDALDAGHDEATFLGDVAIRGYEQPQAIWRLG
ncbi:adenylate/guanylate cyclase domain-containing protein [Tardiphaga alba]|uniref:adenylate/guanylate cyclase domain-containing protein n=1 Tax=Tardiphaga alba TaxID=340268 RepID=UPI0020131092|nr:adenylate/guanylate cyclase domain-containing protein [Tardiphaga alba]